MLGEHFAGGMLDPGPSGDMSAEREMPASIPQCVRWAVGLTDVAIRVTGRLIGGAQAS